MERACNCCGWADWRWCLRPIRRASHRATPASYGDGTFQHGFGVAHFGLHVDNLDEAVEAIRRQGVEILSEPREYSGLRFAYVGGPDGVIVELLEHHGKWVELLGPAPGKKS